MRLARSSMAVVDHFGLVALGVEVVLFDSRSVSENPYSSIRGNSMN